MEPKTVREKAVRDFRRGDPLRDIAVRYEVSEGTVSLWAKAAGLRRKQGCRKKMRPEESDWEIVLAVRKVKNGQPTLDEIGKRFGMTRAGVHRIYHKWKHWEPKAPFVKGDKIRIGTRDYEVLKPDIFHGKARDLKTGKKVEVAWRTDEGYAVKL